MTKSISLVFLCILLCSCAPDMYSKPNATQQEFAGDLNHCLMEAQAISPTYYGMSGTDGLMAAASFGQAKDRCMFSKGWTKDKK